MSIKYVDYIALRNSIRKTQRPSRVQEMLDKLADMWPELHAQMCMGKGQCKEDRNA